jgi:hypothetical protein
VEQVGGRFILVDAIDEEAIRFYLRHSFTQLARAFEHEARDEIVRREPDAEGDLSRRFRLETGSACQSGPCCAAFADGSLRALNVGGPERAQWRISEEELQRYVRENTSGQERPWTSRRVRL